MTAQAGTGAPGPSPSASSVRPLARHAYCPLCGYARTDVPVSGLREIEGALCAGRCTVAWQALTALRLRESASSRLAARRRGEYERGEPHPSALSEILLLRWRAGDWAIAPEDLLLQFETDQAGEA